MKAPATLSRSGEPTAGGAETSIIMALDVCRHIPNFITLLRLLLVVPVVLCLVRERYTDALILFFIAGASDALDGFLARTFGWFSRFGAIADPLADKLLLVCTFITLTCVGVLPLWLTAVVLGRDLLILVGALTYHWYLGPYQMQPSLLGKLSTFTQITYMLVIICQLAGISMPDWSIPWGAVLVALITLLSGLHYTWLWGTRFFTGLKSSQKKCD
jgi:cardiolipin synthase